MRTAPKLLILPIVASVAGCAREESPAPPSPPVLSAPLAQSRAPLPGLSAASFVSAGASVDLFVIRSSELALQRSASPRIRDFARLLIEAHKGTSAQLSFGGRRLNLLPSATLRPSEQAMLDALQSTPEFDAQYVRDERRIHQQAVSLYSSYAANGRSPTLRSIAVAALPIEQRHLRLIAYL